MVLKMNWVLEPTKADALTSKRLTSPQFAVVGVNTVISSVNDALLVNVPDLMFGMLSLAIKEIFKSNL